jgi:fumarate hydratase class I
VELSDKAVSVDLNRPPSSAPALSQLPVKTRLSLTRWLVAARGIAHAKIAERLRAGEEMPQYLRERVVRRVGARAGRRRPGDPWGRSWPRSGGRYNPTTAEDGSGIR